MRSQQKEDFKKRLYSFTLSLIHFIEGLTPNQTTKIIGSQLLRSGTSIIANYIEGKSSSSKKEFLNYFQISLKSANETKVWLCLLRDSGNGDPQIIERLLREADEVANILAASILTMKGKRKINNEK